MKKLMLLTCLVPLISQAQTESKFFKFDFYGRVRADLYYNSRASAETVDGLFFLYPEDHLYDPDGNDINAQPQGSAYSIYSRVGVNITGPKIGAANSSAVVEADFRGSSTTLSVLRVRHAYVRLAWHKSNLLIGQTWHPLYGSVAPSVLNLDTGAPFQPFSRAPQVRYQFWPSDKIQLTAAAVWQSQFTSAGPDGKSNKYLKNSCVPEIFIGADVKGNGWTAGAGAELLSLTPRTTAVANGATYKVDERLTTISAEVHANYTASDWQVSGKTVLASNLTQTSMLGGFAVTSTDPHNGKRDYAPFRTSATWVNATCGHKWQPGIFVGYLKNLGTGKKITSETYGVGQNVGQLVTATAQLSYVVPHWKVGVEIGPSTAWYGSLDLNNGKITDTHSVTNIRGVATMMYIF